MKLVVDRLAAPGRPKELALLTCSSTRRSGEVVVAGKPVKFTISGSAVFTTTGIGELKLI
jgi:hypothetical protein